MANTQQSITVDNLINPMPTTVTGTVSVAEVPAPGVATYVFSFANTAGVVASNNFLTLYNPVGSDDTCSVREAEHVCRDTWCRHLRYTYRTSYGGRHRVDEIVDSYRLLSVCHVTLPPSFE